MQRLRFFLGSTVLLLAATFAMAQTGSIQGTVTDYRRCGRARRGNHSPKFGLQRYSYCHQQQCRRI